LFLPLLGALALLAFMAWAGYWLAVLPYEGLEWGSDYRIRRVDPGGPAAAAGLQVGDLIVAVDGVPANLAYPWYRGKEPDEPISFTVRRADRLWTASLPLVSPPWSERLRRLEPVLIALSFWLIGLAVWMHKPRDGTTRLFLAVSQMGAAALATANLSAFHLEVGRRLLLVLFSLHAPVLIHFHARFPAPKALPRRRLLLGLLYGLALALALPHLLFDLSELTGRSWPSLVVLAYLFAAILTSAAFLLHTYRTASAQTRRQVRLVVLGTVATWLPLVGGSMLPTVLWGHPLWPYELAYPFLLLIPLAYAIAIRRHRLMALDRFLNRSLVTLTLTLLLAGFYLLVSALLGYLGAALGGRLLPGQPLREALVVALVAGVAAVTFYPLRDGVQRWMDRLFYGGWYDYQTVVQDAVRKLTTAATPSDVARVLLDEVAAALKLRCACLFLGSATADRRPLTADSPTSGGPPSAVGGRLGEPQFLPHILGSEACPLRGVRKPGLPCEGALARVLAAAGEPVDRERLRQEVKGKPLSGAEKALLACPHARLWMPLRQGRELLGVLVLGSRVGDDPLSPRDQAIIGTVARHTAVVMENLALLERERQWVTEVETLQRRLIEAREEERKQVARDLHDEVLQDLTLAYRALGDRHHLPPEVAEQKIDEVRQWLHRMIEAVRRICTEQRSPVLDVLGLADAVWSYAEEFESRTGIAVHVTIKGDDEARFPEEVELCLFRVLQEALRNVEKHAQATEVEVELEIRPPTADRRLRGRFARPRTPRPPSRGAAPLQGGLGGRRLPSSKKTAVGGPWSAVILTVRDDGCGFELPPRLGAFIERGCFGLVGVRERLAMVGGRLILSSGPGRGTELVAEVPVTRETDDDEWEWALNP